MVESAARPSVETPALSTEEHRVRQATLTQPEASRVRATTDAAVLIHGEIFFLSNAAGDVPSDGGHALGLFYHDCRFLDGYVLTLNGQTLIPLAHDDERGYVTTHRTSNPELRDDDGRLIAPKNTIAVTRRRVLRGAACYELLTMESFLAAPVSLVAAIEHGARFEDVFLLRGFLDAPRGSVRTPRVLDDRRALHAYDGADGVRRALHVTFSTAVARSDGHHAEFDIDLAPGGTWQLVIVLRIEQTDDRPPADASEENVHPDRLEHWLAREEAVWLDRAAQIRSSDRLLDRAMKLSMIDLGRLRAKMDGLHYFSAGIPWFVTLFGRDAALTALMMLAFERRTARDTLRLLAKYQADHHDAFRDAEPGKILHELRRGELARLGAIPHSPAYYGSVDATVLFLLLLARYVSWSADLALVQEIGRHVDAALAWIERHADHDNDGYVDYTSRYDNAIVNQGWKDSGNALVNQDGSCAEPPIALAEVQGYVYRAWIEVAALWRQVGRSNDADRLDRQAAALKERFERDFWSDSLGCYVIARQRGGRPVTVVSSNAGQVLWSGIASRQHARQTIARLRRPDVASGWGIRTLAASEQGFNPMGYHRGSVWPHDNALVMAGCVRYGLIDDALAIFDAVYSAAAELHRNRLPELYCGFERGQSPRPVSYPVACSPQAWAAAALPYMLTGLLGLRPSAGAGRLELVCPRLPHWLNRLTLANVQVGDAVADIEFWRDGASEVPAMRTTVRRGTLDVRHVETPGDPCNADAVLAS